MIVRARVPAKPASSSGPPRPASPAYAAGSAVHGMECRHRFFLRRDGDLTSVKCLSTGFSILAIGSLAAVLSVTGQDPIKAETGPVTTIETVGTCTSVNSIGPRLS